MFSTLRAIALAIVATGPAISPYSDIQRIREVHNSYMDQDSDVSTWATGHCMLDDIAYSAWIATNAAQFTKTKRTINVAVHVLIHRDFQPLCALSRRLSYRGLRHLEVQVASTRIHRRWLESIGRSQTNVEGQTMLWRDRGPRTRRVTRGMVPMNMRF
ncbi:hypothetical protein C8Q72DRAFT_340088 [Fomitopsis betulina]|nr:hypothetical protein C8Q72DRAFT_340088 [Fomitopsis betulina]